MNIYLRCVQFLNGFWVPMIPLIGLSWLHKGPMFAFVFAVIYPFTVLFFRIASGPSNLHKKTLFTSMILVSTMAVAVLSEAGETSNILSVFPLLLITGVVGFLGRGMGEYPEAIAHKINGVGWALFLLLATSVFGYSRVEKFRANQQMAAAALEERGKSPEFTKSPDTMAQYVREYRCSSSEAVTVYRRVMSETSFVDLRLPLEQRIFSSLSSQSSGEEKLKNLVECGRIVAENEGSSDMLAKFAKAYQSLPREIVQVALGDLRKMRGEDLPHFEKLWMAYASSGNDGVSMDRLLGAGAVQDVGSYIKTVSLKELSERKLYWQNVERYCVCEHASDFAFLQAAENKRCSTFGFNACPNDSLLEFKYYIEELVLKKLDVHSNDVTSEACNKYGKPNLNSFLRCVSMNKKAPNR